MAKIFRFQVGNTMPETTIDNVAEAFLSLESMSPKKLQKLCYYAYAWYYTLYGKRMFRNRFKAWVHGPVDPVLYHEFKDYGWHDIPQYTGELHLNEELLKHVYQVYSSYGEMTGDELEALTHDEDPWIVARGDLPEYAPCQNPISDDVIKEYYEGVLQLND